MKKHYIQDQFNPLKFWIIGKTKCRHYTINQAMPNLNGAILPLYKTAKRESLYRISELVWQDKSTIKALFK